MLLALAADLDDINDRFSGALKGLELALRGTAPDHAELAKRRIRLAQVSSERLRFLTNRLIPVLNEGPSPGHPAAARALEERLRALFADTSSHIGGWGSAKVDADWPGYVAATRRMIARVEIFRAAERREVYPLLATAARAA